MKTINKLRIVLPVALFSTLVITAASASAQNHWKKDKDERGRSEYRERADRGDRGRYNNGHDNRDYAYEDAYRHDNGRGYHLGNYKHRFEGHGYYEHPSYGRVYERFDYRPTVFHHDRDDYYYYGDHFYTYRRGIGYCVIEPPRDVYFRTLPVDCERVYVNGNIFFRHGDLFFQLSPRGYSIATSPVQLRISARF